MNARVAKEEMALLMSGALNYSAASNLSPARPDSLRRAEAARQASRQGGVLGLLRRLGAAIGEMRQRRQVMNELGMLSDRELGDIGLSRSDLPRVFDPEFVASLEAERAASDLPVLRRAA